MIRKSNILFLSSYAFMKGGGQESLYQLIRNLDRKTYNVHIIFPEKGKLEHMARELAFRVSVVPFCRIAPIRFFSVFSTILRLRRYIKKHDINIVHTDGPRMTFYGGVAAYFPRIPVIWHVRASNSEGWWDKILAFLCTKIILVGRALRKRFEWLDDHDRFTVIHNGIDLKQYTLQKKPGNSLRKEIGIDKNTILVGVIGRVERLKGQEYLIRGIGEIKKELGKCAFVVIGDQEKEYLYELNQIIKEYSLDEVVFFIGKKERIEELIPELDLIVHPSLFEAFPRVILEAMACGKPVVGTRVGGVPEAIKEGVTGYLVKPADSKGLSEKILLLVQSEELRFKMGNLARKRAEEHFSIEKNCFKTEQVYKDLIRNGGKEFGDTREFSNSKLLYLGLTKFLYGVVYELAKKRREKSFEPGKCKTILVLSLDRIGDLVLALPVFDNLKIYFPDAKIVVLSNSYAKDILHENRAIDELLIYDSPAYKGLNGKLNLIRNLRQKKINLLVDLSCDNRINTALLSSFFVPEYSVGYNTNYRGGLFHKPVWPPRQVLHQTEVYLKLLKSMGVDCSVSVPFINISETRKQNGIIAIGKKMDSRVVGGKIIFGVCPGGFYSTQRWPEERFAKVCDILGSTGKVLPVLLGGPKDMKSIDMISGRMKKDHIVMSGDYTLKESVDVLSQCSVVLANNSGLLHIAAALGVPTVSTMGPTVPDRWWPVGENHTVLYKEVLCRPCNRGVCDTHECLQEIQVDEVVKALNETISKIPVEKKSRDHF